MNKIIVAPSILSADFANLEKDIKRVEMAGADWIHVDVMDGHFVPNITIGAPVVNSLRKVTKLPLDVHLMINNPENFIDDFAKSGADIITVHYEACEDNVQEVINQIKSHKIKAGLSIKPNTPVKCLAPFISGLDLVLIMTVEPGFGGQSFISDSLAKIKEVKALIEKLGNPNILIEVDGGINKETSKLVVEAGATVLVAGSYVYGATDLAAVIEDIHSL